MKTIFTYLFTLLLMSVTYTSCKEYTSLTNATQVSQLSGNPFIYNVSKSILKNTFKFLDEKGIKSAGGKVNLLTPLSSLITDPTHTTDYVNMLSNLYKIPNGVLAKKYASLSSVKDLIYFVANNGQKFKFY